MEAKGEKHIRIFLFVCFALFVCFLIIKGSLCFQWQVEVSVFPSKRYLL